MRISRCFAFAIAFPFFLSLSLKLVSAQGTRVRSEYEPVQDQDRDQPGARERWFLHGRIIPGESSAALRYRAHLQKMQMRAALAAAQKAGLNGLSRAFSGTGSWTGLGPAPLASDATGTGFQDYGWVSGRATAVAVDPADPTGSTVFVGGAYGGVWKSTNATDGSFGNVSGVTWTPVVDTEATLSVGSIAIQPGNNNPSNSVVLAGTGETNSSVDSYYGLGILRSTDGGSTWALITQSSDASPRPFAGFGFSKIAFSTANPSLVVAAAASATQGFIDGLENPIALNRGIYYSTDAGLSWRFASITDGGVTVDPGSVTSVVYNPSATKFFAAVRYHGIYSSSDGINWTRLSDANQPGAGLALAACPTKPTSGNCPIYRGELAVVPGRNEMYVWYVDGGDNDQGIWENTNGGSSPWAKLSETGITNCGDVFGGCGTSQGFYNLELAAVPNGSATDLYAGAINLYKCTITSGSPTCSGTGANTFLNLTHVYGCSPLGALAHVHPDQHDLDFMVINGKSILYFANDGGIYRALDGYTGLLTGSCSGTNQFDSLNQTLGSMTQFVSFSQHPTDPNTILGGTQDNGSPATTSSQVSSSWLNVNGGDGGYNEINPNSPNEWFTANTDVSIQRCTLGINCHSQDFFNGIVVSNTTVGGDSGAFYTPYILDPQNSGELIVGTCRVWRGTTTGSAFSALSNNFDTGTASPCSGLESNLVRSLAAGGPKDGSGFSNIIYAGTNLQQVSGAPPGGHIWVTTNAAGGINTWADLTGVINPSHFPISGVAIDTSDTTGLTAYVTIMGFHVSHVWKTSNGGASWTDFTGSGVTMLPDAPANAVAVDPGANPTSGTVYVATDVGVFASSSASPSWTEVGPAPDSGQAGYLPNVAVTALRMFNSGGTKKLRASTYGRGVWEFNLIVTPDYQIGFTTSTLTTFPSQNAVFNGTVTALNGYTSSVALSCTGAPPLPSPCTPNPANPTPTPVPGTGFSLTAGGAVGDYSFNLHGIGTDVAHVTHDAALTLHVVDFGLTAPVPNAVTVNVPNTSQPITFQATAAGSFNGTVTLSCTGLPLGAACNFSPSNMVNPVSGSAVTITLTISTANNTPPGTFPVTISAATPGAPAPKTQILTVTVTATADYALTVSNPALSATATTPATFNGTLIAFNGYNSPVNLSCGSGGPPTCAASPVTPGAGGTPFAVTVSSNVVQNYSFNIVGQGTDPLAVTHTAPVTFNSTFDFQLTNTTSPQTVTAGGSATYDLDLNPLGSNFPNAVNLTQSGCPQRSTCSFSGGVAAGSGDTHVILTIVTTAPITASARPARLSLYGFWLPWPGLILIFSRLGRRSARRKQLALFSLLFLIAMLVGLQVACGGGSSSSGGGGQPGTPKGTYNITVTATSGSLTHTTQVTLTVQ